MIAKPRKPRKKTKKAVKRSAAEAGRLQYAALPWRVADGALEIMLVSSRETKRWIIPKGWPMSGRSGATAAAIEAMEEAGLLGIIAEEAFGHFTYSKRFSRGEELCKVEVFPLRVARQRENWPEKHERETQWFAAADAIELVSDPELGDLIAAFARDFGG
jgi:8-oxo-dGTP pyrophosphatase MutT (NUDIX family)